MRSAAGFSRGKPPWTSQLTSPVTSDDEEKEEEEVLREDKSVISERTQIPLRQPALRETFQGNRALLVLAIKLSKRKVKLLPNAAGGSFGFGPESLFVFTHQPTGGLFDRET